MNDYAGNETMRADPPTPDHRAQVSRVGHIDRIPGGCDSCDAYQTIEPMGAGVWLTTVHHDDACPVLAAHTRTGP